MLIIEEIKREMEKDLLGINLDRHEGKIALHYYKDSFKNRFKDYTFVHRTTHNAEYQWEATADLGDGITAFCLVNDEQKRVWEAELDARRNDSTSCERSAS